MFLRLIGKYFMFLLTGFIIVKNLHAGEVLLYGKAPAWSKTLISFYRYKELVTYSEDLLAETGIDEDGTFKLEIQVDETTYIFAHLGIYKAYLYVEPGNRYELVLPPFREKSPADLLNPYFEEIIIQMGIANIDENDINIQIRMFDDTYEPYYNKHVVETVEGKDFSRLDEDIKHIDSHFDKNTNEYFRQYRQYKYAYLRYLSLQHKVTTISEMLFAGKPVLHHHLAYMELFNQVFKNYFLYHGRTDEGKKIYQDINTDNNYHELLITLRENTLFSDDTLLELVVLKCLHDEFYSDRFSRGGILILLDSLILKTGISEHQLIGITIRNKITRLLSGHLPPPFELYDLDSNLVNLEHFKGKYLYLNFCSCSSYTCLKEFEVLQGIYERHKDRLEIVTVAVDTFDESMHSFLKSKSYNWKFLYYGHQSDILEDYDIRAFPTYFLIGPDGKLIQSPAPAPGENFESKLFEVMRSRGDL
ncbi:MAG TPA: TlpA disulfide reductase family protein [Bacteroidales bacterium]|nr:TlpA disulfide reductase family protein [Bacteroidales bacterium]